MNKGSNFLTTIDLVHTILLQIARNFQVTINITQSISLSSYKTAIYIFLCREWGLRRAVISSYSFFLTVTSSLRQCARVRTFNSTETVDAPVKTFSIQVSPIDGSSGALPSLTARQVTVRLHRTCFRGDLRLVNGSDDSQGRVELCNNGRFSAICDFSEWTQLDAITTCRHLGYSGLSGKHI